MTWEKIVKYSAGFFGFIVGLMGGWDLPLKILIILMVTDYLTGVTIALLHKSHKTESGGLSSDVGLVGLVKKGLVLAVIMVAAQLDALTGTAVARQATCFFFIANEGLSILENAALMGVPLPCKLKNALELLQRKSSQDTKKESTENKSND